MIPPCVPMTLVVTAYGWVEHDSRCRLLSALVSVPVSDSDGCSVDGPRLSYEVHATPTASTTHPRRRAEAFLVHFHIRCSRLRVLCHATVPRPTWAADHPRAAEERGCRFAGHLVCELKGQVVCPVEFMVSIIHAAHICI